MGVSADTAQQILDHFTGNGTWTPPATLYLALYITDPARDNSGTEVSGGAYARQVVAFDPAADVASLMTALNTALLTFPTATAPWGLVAFAAVMDHLTNSNPDDLEFWGPLTHSKDVDTDDVLKFAIGDVALTQE